MVLESTSDTPSTTEVPVEEAAAPTIDNEATNPLADPVPRKDPTEAPPAPSTSQPQSYEDELFGSGDTPAPPAVESSSNAAENEDGEVAEEVPTKVASELSPSTVEQLNGNQAPKKDVEDDDDDDEDLFGEGKPKSSAAEATPTEASTPGNTAIQPSLSIPRKRPPQPVESPPVVGKNTAASGLPNGLPPLSMSSPAASAVPTFSLNYGSPPSSSNDGGSQDYVSGVSLGLPEEVKIPRSIDMNILEGRLLEVLQSLPASLQNDALQEYDEALTNKGHEIRNKSAYLFGVLKRYTKVHSQAKLGGPSAMMGASLTPQVTQRLEALVQSGFCTREEMNEKMKSKLKMLTEQDALKAMEELSSVERSQIRNFGSYFMGILNRYMRGDQKPPGLVYGGGGRRGSSDRYSRRGRSPDRDSFRYGGSSNKDSYRRDRSRDSHSSYGPQSSQQPRNQFTPSTYGGGMQQPPTTFQQQQPQPPNPYMAQQQQAPPMGAPYQMQQPPPPPPQQPNQYQPPMQQQPPYMGQQPPQPIPQMIGQQPPNMMGQPQPQPLGMPQQQQPPNMLHQQQTPKAAPSSLQSRWQPRAVEAPKQQQMQPRWQPAAAPTPASNAGPSVDILGLADQAAKALAGTNFQAAAPMGGIQQQQPTPFQQQPSYGMQQQPMPQQQFAPYQQQPQTFQQQAAPHQPHQPYNSSQRRNHNAQLHDLPQNVQYHVQMLSSSGFIVGPLDNGILGMLADLPESSAIASLQRFMSLNKAQMRNPTAYLIGLLRRELQSISRGMGSR